MNYYFYILYNTWSQVGDDQEAHAAGTLIVQTIVTTVRVPC